MNTFWLQRKSKPYYDKVSKGEWVAYAGTLYTSGARRTVVEYIQIFISNMTIEFRTEHGFIESTDFVWPKQLEFDESVGPIPIRVQDGYDILQEYQVASKEEAISTLAKIESDWNLL